MGRKRVPREGPEPARDPFEQRRADYIDALIRDMARPEFSARLSRVGLLQLVSRAEAMHLAAQMRTPIPLPPEASA